MKKDLVNYIESNIFPKYDKYYAHGMMHINDVINDCLMMAKYYNLDENICYAMGAYHDLGLSVDRNNHEFEGGKIVESDLNLKKFFNDDEIKLIKEAVEDHRGSRKERPRSIYGEVLSDADRDFDVALLAKRQFNTSLKNYPNLKTFDEHFERSYNYILGRINKEGHFNLWTNNEVLIERRKKFEEIFLDKDKTKLIYQKEYEKIINDGTYKKIMNYYEDY